MSDDQPDKPEPTSGPAQPPKFPGEFPPGLPANPGDSPPGDPNPGNPGPPDLDPTRTSRFKTWMAATQERLLNFEPAMLAEWVNRTFQKQGASFYGKVITMALCTYFLADLTAIMAGRLIPESAPGRGHRGSLSSLPQKTQDEYNVIIGRNLFNSEHRIPGEESPSAGAQDLGGPATKTTLPFNLIGTLILRDELKSIATIEDKSASMVYPVRVQDEIPSKAKIIKIEATRVTFLNVGSGRREFVELPEDFQGNAPRITLGTRGGPGIEQVSPTQFNVSRSEVDRALGDLNSILTQARAVPNWENGVPNGYKLFQIVPGSIFEKLGLKNEDVILGLDGQPINDPGKAFEMLGRLRDSPHLELQVRRGGRTSTFAYDFR